jgi:UDP-perosamine 4-acetyltransferase
VIEVRKNMEEMVVIGGGGHARVIIGILKKLKRYSILGYTAPNNCGDSLGIPYLGSDNEIVAVTSESQVKNAVIAVGQVGSGTVRQGIWHRLTSLRLVFPGIVSPNAIVNDDVDLADAIVVMDGAIINAGAKLGTGVIANTHSTIEHDVALGEWVHVAPGAIICGGVRIGAFSMVGAGATVIEGRSICANTVVGAGATVVHDLLEPGIYVGTPARRIK